MAVVEDGLRRRRGATRGYSEGPDRRRDRGIGIGREPAPQKTIENSPPRYRADECSCVGGAARRSTAFTRRGANVVALEAGGHFFGSGLFFDAFQGRAGAEFFVDSRYDAWCLSEDDFGAADAARDRAESQLLQADDASSPTPPRVPRG